jgi:NitT/TauT family transport system substrate-binding protein
MKRFFTYLGLLVATAAFLISCTQVTTPEVKLSPVKVGFSAWPGWLPWQVTSQVQLFSKEGPKVAMQWFDSYSASLQALKEGKIVANSQTLNDTITAVAAGDDQVVVLVNDNSTGNDKIIVRPGIKTVLDLKGKRVAVEQGTVDHFLLLLGLKKAGMTVQDIEIVNLETSKAAEAFVAGQVDAAAVFAPFTTQALKRPGSRELFSSKNYPGAISDHLVVQRRFIQQHPDQVQRLVNGWFETLNYIQANQATALTMMATQAGVSDAEYQQYAQGTKLFTIEENLKAFYPVSEMESLSFMAGTVADYLLETGLVKQLPKVDQLFDDRFVKAYAAEKGKA